VLKVTGLIQSGVISKMCPNPELEVTIQVLVIVGSYQRYVQIKS